MYVHYKMSVPVPKDIKKTIDDAIDLALYYMMERPEENIDYDNLDYDARIINHTIVDLYRILDLLMMDIFEKFNPNGDKSNVYMYHPSDKGHKFCIDVNHKEYKDDENGYLGIMNKHYINILGANHPMIDKMVKLTASYIPRLQTEISVPIKNSGKKGPKILKEDAQVITNDYASNLFALRTLRNIGIHRSSLKIIFGDGRTSNLGDNTYVIVFNKSEMFDHVEYNKIFKISVPILSNKNTQETTDISVHKVIKSFVSMVNVFWAQCSYILDLKYDPLFENTDERIINLFTTINSFSTTKHKHDLKKLIDCNDIDETKMKDLYDYIKTCIKK